MELISKEPSSQKPISAELTLKVPTSKELLSSKPTLVELIFKELPLQKPILVEQSSTTQFYLELTCRKLSSTEAD